MPSNYQSKSIDAAKVRLTAAELARRHSLAILIRHYEAVRLIRGPQRDEAERALGAALAKSEGPFSHGGFIWQWSPSEKSFFRHKATKMHLVKQRS